MGLNIIIQHCFSLFLLFDKFTLKLIKFIQICRRTFLNTKYFCKIHLILFWIFYEMTNLNKFYEFGRKIVCVGRNYRDHALELWVYLSIIIVNNFSLKEIIQSRWNRWYLQRPQMPMFKMVGPLKFPQTVQIFTMKLVHLFN